MAEWLNIAIEVGFWTALVLLSALKLWRVWRLHGNPNARELALIGGPVSVLPKEWRRWILGEQSRH
jgi:hypothetical protein